MKVAVLLFQEFETLDVFGPVEILGRLPEIFEIEYYSLTGGVVNSTQGVAITTRLLEEITSSPDIFLIPGGKGTRQEVNNRLLIESVKQISRSSRYVLTVCTGSALLANTTLLDHKTATSNKRAFDWVMSVRREVHWKRKARWTVDGKYYTSSGISAGMDMALAFVADIVGGETANRVAAEMEYLWNKDPENDPFCGN